MTLWQRRGFMVSGAVVLSGTVFGLALTESIQVYFLTVLIIFLGLPHGALDPLVAHRAGMWDDARSFTLFIGKYLFLAACALLVWLLAPGAALLTFLLYSGYHFAGDWKGELPLGSRLAGGFYVVSMPSAIYANTTRDIFALLAGTAHASWIVGTMQLIALPAAIGLAFGILFYAKGKNALRLELGTLFVAGMLLPPLLFFVLYFCALHSPRHLIKVAAEEPARLVACTVVVFTLLTLILGVAIYPLVSGPSLTDDMLRMVFIGLAVLTVPHMVLVERKLPQ